MPYNTPGVADGLAMSSDKPTYVPPSIYKVFDAIEKETGVLNLDRNPKLDRWAEQGVFLFNTILTVEVNQPKSHAGKGWEQFTSRVISELKNHPHNLVVFLWGRDAQQFRLLIENDRHLILETEHPAAATRNSRDWENMNCFTKCNEFLQASGYGAIEW